MTLNRSGINFWGKREFFKKRYSRALSQHNIKLPGIKLLSIKLLSIKLLGLGLLGNFGFNIILPEMVHATAAPVAAPAPKLNIALAQARKTALIQAFKAEMAAKPVVARIVNDISAIQSAVFAELLAVDSALKGIADNLGGIADGPNLHGLALEINLTGGGNPPFTLDAINNLEAPADVVSTDQMKAYNKRVSGLRLKLMAAGQAGKGTPFSDEELLSLSPKADALVDLMRGLNQGMTRDVAAGLLRESFTNLSTMPDQDGNPGEAYFITVKDGQALEPGSPYVLKSPDLPMEVA